VTALQNCLANEGHDAPAVQEMLLTGLGTRSFPPRTLSFVVLFVAPEEYSDRWSEAQMVQAIEIIGGRTRT
jgi:hypothetical protein